MTDSSCDEPIGLERLLDYRLGELSDADEERIEEHYFGCRHCSAQLADLEQCAAAVASHLQRGEFLGEASGSLLAEASRRGMRVRVYRLEPGGSVQCRADSADDLVVLRLGGRFARDARVDVAVDGEFETGGSQSSVFESVAIDYTASEIVLVYPRETVLSFPKATFRVVASDRAAGEAGELEYTLFHTPEA